MATGNKEVTDFTVVPDPVNSDIYCVKSGADYRVRIGVAGGLASLGGDGKLTAGQVPAFSVAWASITGKPTTFTPSAHTHAATDITSGILATARGGTGTASSTGSGANVLAVSPALTGSPTASEITLGGGKKLSKITVSNAPPGALADGELYLKY